MSKNRLAKTIGFFFFNINTPMSFLQIKKNKHKKLQTKGREKIVELPPPSNVDNINVR